MGVTSFDVGGKRSQNCQLKTIHLLMLGRGLWLVGWAVAATSSIEDIRGFAAVAPPTCHSKSRFQCWLKVLTQPVPKCVNSTGYLDHKLYDRWKSIAALARKLFADICE